jgi:CRP-like cAMP-binding protein
MARREIAPEVFSAVQGARRRNTGTTGDGHHAAHARARRLFRKGDPATGMNVVVYGEIKLIATTPARGPRLSGIVGPGQSFGEPVMLLERYRAA